MTTAVRPIAIAVLLLAALDAQAFPTFARKYETSCQTCHVAMPKLNSFGIAFRNSGYQWPGAEEEMTKDKPVTLAAEANKEAFPDTLWPSWLPRTPPIAFLLAGEVTGSRQNAAFFSPEGLGAEVEVGLGGAIAHDIAARADLTLEADGSGKVELGLEQVFAQFHNLEGHQHLDVRVGKIWPELFSFAPQALGGDYWLYDRSIGANPWKLAGQLGLEVRGTFFAGRLRTILGTSGSTGDLGKSWDAWARIGYKIGGLRYDGVDESSGEAALSADASRPWRDNSVQLGVFAYKGFAVAPGALAADGTQADPLHDDFIHGGADVSVWLGDANLVGALVIGRHSRLAPGVAPSTVVRASVQLDYIVFPWLIPTLRFELSDDARHLDYSADAPLWHVVPGVTALIRANVKAYVFAEVIPDQQQQPTFNKLTVGFLAAF
jgi:hypothetical protein